MTEPIKFETMVKLYNTVELVANDFWRKSYPVAVSLVSAVVWGYVEDLTPRGWAAVQELLKDVEAVSPLTLLNPNNLPVIT